MISDVPVSGAAVIKHIMKQICYLVLFLTFSTSFAFSQATLRGKVSDENGEAMIGASVILKANHAVGCVTDLDGNYSLSIPSDAPQVVQISYVSYATIEETVTIKKGEVLVKNFVMGTSAHEMKGVEIVAKATKARDYYMEKMKLNSSVTIDYVSAESMKKVGDASVAAAVSRVTGVSTNGAFITVRGIGDRYVKTGINGMRIPTLDPFTNNIKLDMFPSSLVDNILITKTASPDLPGDWAGAYLSVETKDYPEKLSVNVETAFGYNAQTSFKDVLTSEHSSTEWLGYDNTLRSYDHGAFVDAKPTLSTYEQLVALGLGDYYASLGVTGSTPWNDTYYKLGLIQLGLLAPAQIDDAAAFTAAKDAYLHGNYASDAFKTANAAVPASAHAFANNWNLRTKQAPLNFSQSFSIGNQTKLFHRDFGYIMGFKYGSAVQSDASAESNRAAVAANDSGVLVRTYASRQDQNVTKESNGWSGLLNLACKLNPNNTVALMFMPNYSGVNNTRQSVDYRDPSNYVVTLSQFYEQRRQLVYQLRTEHYLPASKVKIEANASYTDGKSSAPDFKNLQYYKDPISNAFQIGGSIGDGIHRYYRYLSDKMIDSRLSAEIPLDSTPGLTRKIKFGGAYQHTKRDYNQYDYAINFGPTSYALLNEDIDAYLSPDKFDVRSGVDVNGIPYSTLDLYYVQFESPANHTIGTSDIASAFAMTDYALTSLLRVSGGVRVEQSKLFTDVAEFDAKGYASGDPRRNYKDGMPAANPAHLNETSILPSLNVVYKLKIDDAAPMNARFNYSRSIARPSIRELSDVAVYDYEYRAFVFGNSDLKSVQIDNYDLRYESYFKNGDNFSASVFYKYFKNHIELVQALGYSWQNVPKSTVAGIELEGRKKILKCLEARANITLVQSKTEFVKQRLEIEDGGKKYTPVDTLSRQMFGQAPYVFNAILTYTADSAGFSATVSYNRQGPRLVVAADVKEIPDIYELPRNVIDLKLSKTLGKHFTASLTVKDILNEPVRRSYNYSEGWVVDYDKYRYGTTYTLGLSYKL